MILRNINNFLIKSFLPISIVLLVNSCNIKQEKTNSVEMDKNNNNIEQINTSMKDKEQLVYNTIKESGQFGISSEDISKKTSIPENEVINILTILDKKNLIDKTKADGVKMVNGKKERFGCLIYTAREK